MKRLLIFPLLAATVLFSCRPYRYDPGPITTETRVVPAFSSLSVYGEIDVFFTSDSSYQVKVEAHERLQDQISTQVSSNRLRVEQTGNSYWYADAGKVYIAQLMYDDLYFSGSGDITGSGLQVVNSALTHYGSGDVQLGIAGSTLNISTYGSGDILLNGTISGTTIKVTGSGDVDVKDVVSSNSSIIINGSGDVYVQATDTLTITINGSGDVFYRGNPIINSQINGSGSITHIN